MKVLLLVILLLSLGCNKEDHNFGRKLSGMNAYKDISKIRDPKALKIRTSTYSEIVSIYEKPDFTYNLMDKRAKKLASDTFEYDKILSYVFYDYKNDDRKNVISYALKRSVTLTFYLNRDVLVGYFIKDVINNGGKWDSGPLNMGNTSLNEEWPQMREDLSFYWSFQKDCASRIGNEACDEYKNIYGSIKSEHK
ncbi:hypothetical protein [Leptospira yasudae]|uniref:Lipoprotein n=1 Tax=Leptospira yasudae TaxID=2202201 RepID=A0ABX9M5C9_9LEPT|nr:hypothetical protein [Leptospira yasudae]RHX80919.1 hypothetical protein DLM77_08610 [Leptospira yasudae]